MILETEIEKVYRRLDEYFDELDIDDHQQLNTYFRTTTSLLEKLLKMQERIYNVQKFQAYEAIILEVVGQLDDETRELFVSKLEKVNSRFNSMGVEEDVEDEDD